MDVTRVDAALRETMEDHRLSRAERRALREALTSHDALEPDWAFVRHRAFALAREAMQQGPGDWVLDWLERAIKAVTVQPTSPRQAADACFSPGDACRNRIHGLLAGARETVDICVFTITDNALADAILAAHVAGRGVRVITDNLKAHDRGSDIERLEKAGVAVRPDQSEHHMHHKYAIFDGRILLTGSYNWTRSAARDNRENVVVTEDTRLVRAFQERFDEFWQELG